MAKPSLCNQTSFFCLCSTEFYGIALNCRYTNAHSPSVGRHAELSWTASEHTFNKGLCFDYTEPDACQWTSSPYHSGCLDWHLLLITWSDYDDNMHWLVVVVLSTRSVLSLRPSFSELSSTCMAGNFIPMRICSGNAYHMAGLSLSWPTPPSMRTEPKAPSHSIYILRTTCVRECDEYQAINIYENTAVLSLCDIWSVGLCVSRKSGRFYLWNELVGHIWSPMCYNAKSFC